jgi:glycine dehydrogenase subunit 2
MKHNPRLNEKLARLPGFADLHPLQPAATVPGAFELIDTLAHWLKTLTGMPAVALSPGAGAHGELCGMMTIRAALEARGDRRSRVLVPESAHGTNPATAAACGYAIDPVPGNPQGRVDLDVLRRKLGPDVAALMLTNPNTCGLFENEILDIAAAVHAAGAFFYCDGANFNAIVGRVRPADLGIDCMHLNLHKTFSTPHGGGGPGSGPVALAASLAPYAPLPWLVHGKDGLELAEHKKGPADHAIGRLKGFHGQMGMFVRALAYMMSHGADGLRQVAEDAVVNANYLRARLDGDLSLSFPGPCMHEVLFDDRFLKDTGITTLDLAKGADRRGVSSDDDVLSAGGPRSAVDRADRDREQGLARPVRSRSEGARHRGSLRRRRALSCSTPVEPAPPPRRNSRRTPADSALAAGLGAPRSSRIRIAGDVAQSNSPECQRSPRARRKSNARHRL